MPYLLGRSVYDFVTGRRGIDINQPSRLQAYSQLKLLLALNDSIDPKLREEVNGRLENLSLNPFENDLKAEANLARQQYDALVAFAKRPDGLAAKLERDRRVELTSLEHVEAFNRLGNRAGSNRCKRPWSCRRNSADLDCAICGNARNQSND